MSIKIRAYAAMEKGKPLVPLEYDPGALRPEQVEIKMTHCGMCHSDQSLIDDEWGMTTYPLVPGHEIVGTVIAAGNLVKRVKVGDRVGLGWFSGSCMTCAQCLAGDHNLCPNPESTMFGRYGGYADRVRCDWIWAAPLPEAIGSAEAAPMFCGGITVFNPILQCGVQPTDRVGVIGIGGLGHLALQFLNKWGCEVVAFTSSDSKREEAFKLGAHKVVNTRNSDDLAKLAGSLNFILVTANANLDWPNLINVLTPRGRLHVVGVTPEPVPLPIFPAILGQKSISASPVGSPGTVSKMLEFSARHGIGSMVERYPISRVNEALEHLRSGKARYRIVLENDIA
jgi:uncharacterized zinc-type alcohol dehydrogenase-like protein